MVIVLTILLGFFTVVSVTFALFHHYQVNVPGVSIVCMLTNRKCMYGPSLFHCSMKWVTRNNHYYVDNMLLFFFTEEKTLCDKFYRKPKNSDSNYDIIYLKHSLALSTFRPKNAQHGLSISS